MAARPQHCASYARRRPELTPCYRIIQEHLATFVAERQAEERPLPDYVLKEFDAYLKCGILSHGFLRLACTGCQKEKIVAFSCKKRGFCPSCSAKRMAEASTHLVENVLPVVAYRQFVITFPIPMRFWLQANKKLYTKVHQLVIRELHAHYRCKAEAEGIKDSMPGSISFSQRSGSALNVNPHLHILCPDGVYARVNKKARFHNLAAITDEEVATLIEGVTKKVMRHLTKQGYLDQDGEIVLNPATDEPFAENSAMGEATVSSIGGKIAFGPNAGKYVTKIGPGFGYGEEIPLAKGRRCFSINGFSLHANTSVNALQREKLDKLIQYMARGPLSNERLEIQKDGNVKLRLKTPWGDGTTHLLFTPGEFIEKLAALLPPSRTHLVRWSGCFAPNSPYRQEITLKPHVKKGFQFKKAGEQGKKAVKNHSWSRMLARVFKIDVTRCDGCGEDMIVVCAVTERSAVERYLKHIGVDHMAPARAPPRFQQDSFNFDQSSDAIAVDVVDYRD